MSVAVKKLAQVAVGSIAELVVDGVINGHTEIREIWLANNSTTTMKNVTIYAHGIDTANVLIPKLTIEPQGSKVINNAHIVVTNGSGLYALHDDTGQIDLIVTIYGIDETY